MRLNEVESQGERQTNQVAALSEAVEDHRQRTEQLYALQEQLERLGQTLVSSHLEAAQTKAERSLDLVSGERAQLEQEREVLIRENLELMELCSNALEKAETSLARSGLLQSIGRGLAAEALKIGAGVVTGLLLNKPDAADQAIEARMGRAAEATKQHIERLKKTKEQLLEARKLLDWEAP